MSHLVAANVHMDINENTISPQLYFFSFLRPFIAVLFLKLIYDPFKRHPNIGKYPYLNSLAIYEFLSSISELIF